MKRVRSIMTLAVLLSCLALLTLAGFAEEKPVTGPMTTKAVEQPASPAPTAIPQLRVKTIFDYKKELALTQDQEEKLRAIWGDFQGQMTRLKAKLQVAELDLSDLLKSRASLEVVKAKLQESEKLRVDLRFADIEASRKIEGVLSRDQSKKWQEIKKEAQAKRKSEASRSSTKNP